MLGKRKKIRGYMNWNHIILEGFCCRKFSCKKDKYIYELIDVDKWKTKKVKNPNYDPKYKVPKKPKYCKGKICQDCFFEKCPHLGIGELPDDEYKKIMKCINSIYKDE